MNPFPSSDEFFIRLHRAGWSVGETQMLTAAGLRGLVTGSNGENLIHAEGQTADEAWHLAVQQAPACGMCSFEGKQPYAPTESAFCS